MARAEVGREVTRRGAVAVHAPAGTHARVGQGGGGEPARAAVACRRCAGALDGRDGRARFWPTGASAVGGRPAFRRFSSTKFLPLPLRRIHPRGALVAVDALPQQERELGVAPQRLQLVLEASASGHRRRLDRGLSWWLQSQRGHTKLVRRVRLVLHHTSRGSSCGRSRCGGRSRCRRRPQPRRRRPRTSRRLCRAARSSASRSRTTSCLWAVREHDRACPRRSRCCASDPGRREASCVRAAGASAVADPVCAP